MDIPAPNFDRRHSTIILVTVVMLFWIFGWMAVATIAYDQFFRRVSSFRSARNDTIVMWNGEILFPQQQVNFTTGPGGPSQIMALDPQTGRIRDTGISISNNVYAIFADDDRLRIVSQTEVVNFDGTTLLRYQPQLKLAQMAIPSVLDGALSFIAEDGSGHFRLHTFVAGEWIAGPKVALPGPDRTWVMDAERDQLRVVPRTSQNGISTVGSWEFVRLLQVGNDVHLFYISFGANNQTIAYRRGIDFVSNDGMTASALAPENSAAEVTGWTPLDSREFNYSSTPCRIHGELMLLSSRRDVLLLKIDPLNPRRFVSAPIDIRAEIGQTDSLAIVSSPSTDDIYLLAMTRTGSRKVFRLSGNHFDPLPYRLPGNGDLIFAWEISSALQIFAVWTAANLILLVGANGLVSKWKSNRYTFGHDIVHLAPVSRRCLARAIDFLSMSVPLVAVALWIVSRLDADQLLNAQIELLYDIDARVWNPSYRYQFQLLQHLRKYSRVDESMLYWLVLACTWTLAYLISLILMQGRWGITFGKWIFGIRVVRTTLRPCGFTRSLLRELMMCVDTLNLISPIPGVTSMLLTEDRRRLGDRVADTIMIDCPVIATQPETSRSIT